MQDMIMSEVPAVYGIDAASPSEWDRARAPANQSALNTQVDGDHYKDMAIQPVVYIHANGMGFMEGCIVKYISRYKNKNGKQDLLKAKHLIDLILELEYPEG